MFANTCGRTVLQVRVFFQSSGNSGNFSNSSKLRCESNILSEGGFHPVSKDVNRIMKSFFDGDEAEDKHVVGDTTSVY